MQTQANIRKFMKGFTLIELMIVVVIVAILLAIAYPSYTQYVERSRRNDAQAALLELANYMERNYSNTGGYATDPAGNNISLPFTTTPKGAAGTDVYYNLSLTPLPTQNTFTLQADPANAQAGDPCGTLTLDQTGVEGADQADCW